MVDEKKVRDWFAQEVKERMEDAGLASYQIAYYCRVKHENIYGYLQGRPFPKLWNTILLAECLDCSVNDLLGYDEIDDVNVYERLLASTTYRDELDFSEHFAKRLVRMLDDNATLPKDLSKHTGIGLSAIEKWAGDVPVALPSVLNLLRICSALECTPSDLLGY